MYRTIVCATDFSACSREALETATRLALQTKAELLLVHAWHVPSSMYSGTFILPASVLGDVHRNAERLLDEERAEAERSGVARVRTALVRGAAWDQIVEVAHHEKADLCVLGRHGRSGVSRLLPGSITERVVRHAPCPVLVVPTGSPTAAFENVVCLVDFSPHSRAALEAATRMVASRGSLTLLHVIDVPSILGNDLMTTETRQTLERRAVVEIEKWAALAAASTDALVRTNIRRGSPTRQVAAMLAEASTTDLVSVGGYGRTGIGRVLLGSIAETAIRNARCAVLVVRDPDLVTTHGDA